MLLWCFLLLFYKDQRELAGEGHERYYWKVEVSISAILHSIAERGTYLTAIIGSYDIYITEGKAWLLTYVEC